MTVQELDDAAILALVAQHQGNATAAALAGGLRPSTLRSRITRTPALRDAVAALRTRETGPPADSETLDVRGDTATMDVPNLADSEKLMRQRGFDPDEWTVERAKVNEWGGADGTDNRQLTIHLKRALSLQVLCEPMPVEPIRPPAPKPVSGRPRRGFMASDFHAPFHDPAALAAFLIFCREIDLDFGIFAGDVSDVPEPSRHRRNPAFYCTPKESFRAGHQILSSVREQLPDADMEFLTGNHDARVRNWLLQHAPDLADITPPDDDVPLLSLRRLLGLDSLHIKATEPEGEYADGEVRVCRNLSVIHGERTGKNATDDELATYGHSLAFGHTHRKDTAFKTQWDFDGPAIHTAINLGCMCLIEGGLGYTRRPNWQPGFGVAEVWDDGAFTVDHAHFVNGNLLWRDFRVPARTVR